MGNTPRGGQLSPSPDPFGKALFQGSHHPSVPGFSSPSATLTSGKVLWLVHCWAGGIRSPRPTEAPSPSEPLSEQGQSAIETG